MELHFEEELELKCNVEMEFFVCMRVNSLLHEKVSQL